MSTRGNIGVKVRNSDFAEINARLIEYLVKPLSEESPYLFIYNHHDSYVTGLGRELVDKYNSYNQALSLILDGDCSFPGAPYKNSEGYGYNHPKVASEPFEMLQEEYLYIFEDDEWKAYDSEKTKLVI